MKLEFNNKTIEVSLVTPRTGFMQTQFARLWNQIDIQSLLDIESEKNEAKKTEKQTKFVVSNIDIEKEINCKLALGKLLIDRTSIKDKKLIEAIETDIESEFWQSQDVQEIYKSVFPFRGRIKSVE